MISRTASKASVHSRKFSIVQTVCKLSNLAVEDNESLVVNMCTAHYYWVQVCHNDTVGKLSVSVKMKIIFRCYLIATTSSHLVLGAILTPSEHFHALRSFLVILMPGWLWLLNLISFRSVQDWRGAKIHLKMISWVWFQAESKDISLRTCSMLYDFYTALSGWNISIVSSCAT